MEKRRRGIFRIVQIAPLLDPFCFQIEEKRKVWYYPWQEWYLLKTRSYEYNKKDSASGGFHSLEEARTFIEKIQARRHEDNEKLLRQRNLQEEMRQFPLVIEYVKYD